MSYRYWGCAHSDMLDVYIHLSQEMNSDSYKRTMGIYFEDSKRINSIASICVGCGKLIPSGSLCKQCEEIKMLNESNTKAMLKNEELQKQVDAIQTMFNEDVIKAIVNVKVKEMMKKSEINI
jgi:hypothetical protein